MRPGTASTDAASEIVFALAWTLGYRCAPAWPTHRLWRIDAAGDGPLQGLARNRINTILITCDRGEISSSARSFFGYGVALSGVIGSTLIVSFGWQAGYWGVGGIALLAVAVRFFCPESPYSVRMKDRKVRIREALARGEDVPVEGLS